jgi:hypothetical protein
MKIALLAAAGLLLALPATTQAGPPGSWSLVGDGRLVISGQNGVARTPDGILHVAWQRLRPDGAGEVIHTPISSAGAVGASMPIVTGWSSVGDPSLVAQGATLTAFFPGTPTTQTGNPQDGLDMATSGDGGTSWAVGGNAIYRGEFSGVSVPSAVAVGGTLLESWYAPDGTVVHAGLDPNTPAQHGYGTGGLQNLTTDGAGTALVAWCANSAPEGIYVQRVDPASGGPIGASALAPGSANAAGSTFCPASGRVQLVARPGGGYFAAYTDGSRSAVRLWPVGARAATPIAARASIKQEIALTAAPDGRLWVGWTENNAFRFRRSNTRATVFGATVTVAVPPAARRGETYQLDLAAQRDRTDAIVRTQDDGNRVATYSTQVLPRLTLVATGRRLRAAFLVTDAGDPVRGATVTVAGHRARTNSAGQTSIGLAAGRYAATATKALYVKATRRVRVRARK